MGAQLAKKQVNRNIQVIKHDPAAFGIGVGHLTRNARLFQMQQDCFGDSLEMRDAVGAGNQVIIGEQRMTAHIEPRGLTGLHVFHDRENPFRQLA